MKELDNLHTKRMIRAFLGRLISRRRVATMKEPILALAVAVVLAAAVVGIGALGALSQAGVAPEA